MDYIISYNIRGVNRPDILKDIPFSLHIKSYADLEDRDLVKELIVWMNNTGRTVVQVQVPTSCNTCSGWTMLRDSIYSPPRHKNKSKSK